MKKLELNKQTFEIVTPEELELVGGAKNSNKCATAATDCGCISVGELTCEESFCYCDS